MAKDINGVLYAYENKDELAFGTSLDESPKLNTTGTVYRFLKKRELDKRANDALREREMSREEAFDMVMGQIVIIVVDNFFDDRIFNAVYDEISRLEFNDVKVGADNDGTWTAEEGVEYPGVRTQVFYKVRPLLDDAIIRQLDNTPTPFTSKAYNYYQYAHLRLEKDNDDDFIHTDNADWAYLIYMSKTNLESGTKFYTDDEKETNFVRFVQNRLVIFNCNIKHMAFKNHGKDINDGRLTINGICDYV